MREAVTVLLPLLPGTQSSTVLFGQNQRDTQGKLAEVSHGFVMV